MSTDADYLVEGVPRPAGRHVCLPELLEQVRFRFDIKETSLRLTDAQITYLLNRSREKLFKILVEYDDARLRVQTDLATAAGVATVALPERTYAPVRLAYTDSDGCERDIPVANYSAMRLGPSNDPWTRRKPSYYVTSTEIVIVPTPATVQTLKFVYIASWADLEAAPSDFECWDGVQPEWDEWVLNNTLVTLALRSRRGEDAAMFREERDGITGRLMTAVRMEGYEAPTQSSQRRGYDEDDC